MKILFISATLQERNGVGSFRSIALYKKLISKHNDIAVVADESYNAWNIFKNIVFYKYDAIYFSGPPFGVYFVALYVGMLLSSDKLIMDIRDPWSFHIEEGYGGTVKPQPSGLKAKLARFIEKRIYKRCSRFIVCTPGLAARYGLLFGDSEKISLIYNGHQLDESLLKERASALKKERSIVKIVCCGAFAYTGNVMACRLMNRLKGEKNKYIELNFVGTDNRTVDIFKNVKMKNIKIVFTERMPYKMALKKVIEADVGILALRNEDFDYGTKVFDYIGLGVPIYDLFDHEKMFYKNFKAWITDRLDELPQLDVDINMKYSREAQTERLYEIIKEEII